MELRADFTRRETYPKGSWLRSPHLSAHHPFTGSDGALTYVKTGHLAAYARADSLQV